MLIRRITFFIILICSLNSLQLYSQSHTNRTDSILSKGIKLYDGGKYKKAIDFFEKVVGQGNHSADVFYEIALSYYKLGFLQKAIDYCDKAIQKDRTSSLALLCYTLKSRCQASKNNDIAIRTLLDVKKLFEKQSLWQEELALAYHKKGDEKSALNHIKKALYLSKFSAPAFLLFGQLSWMNKNWVDAVFAYQLSILLAPENPDSKYAFSQIMDIFSKEKSREISRVNGLMMDFSQINKALKNSILEFEKKNKNVNSFDFFYEMNKVFITEVKKQNNGNKVGELIWDYFEPFFSTLLSSPYFYEYSRYISTPYFKDSKSWWNKNKVRTLKFAEWMKK